MIRVDIMKSQKTFKQFVLISFALLFLGCTPQYELLTPTAISLEVEPSYTAINTEVVLNISPTTEPTLLPTIRPKQLSTPSLVPTTATFTVTTTSMPTVSPKEIEFIVDELFQNNGNCLLPCFWGFTPGQTRWSEVEHFLQPIAFNIRNYEIGADITLLDPTNNNSPDLHHFYVFKGDKIKWIEATILQTAKFQISAILETYGPPDEIRILTANAEREGYWRSQITLFYLRQGFLLTYGSDNSQEGDKISMCNFQADEKILLLAWIPDETISVKTILEEYLQLYGEADFYLSVEEATKMKVEEFYETFRDANTPVCLKTPPDIWPMP